MDILHSIIKTKIISVFFFLLFWCILLDVLLASSLASIIFKLFCCVDAGCIQLVFHEFEPLTACCTYSHEL